MRWHGFIQSNIRGNPVMSNAKVVSDLQKLDDYGTLFAVSEMWHYTELAQQVYPTKRWRHVTKPGCSTGLIYRRDVWQTLGSGFWPLHGAVPGVSDSRDIAWALLRNRHDPDVTIMAMSVHQTPSAWSNRLTPKRRAVARAAWQAGRREVIRRVKAALQLDIPVWVAGDWNYKPRPFLKKDVGQRVRYVSNGIDKHTFVDSASASWRLKWGSRRIYRQHSDHHGLALRARVVTKRRLAAAWRKVANALRRR